MADNNANAKREYAWNYFQLHAGQRMASFNFFVVIAALLTTALAATFTNDCVCRWFGVPVGLSLSAVSFVFWKLDQRVRYLVKHAEAALKTLETEWMKDDGEIQHHLALFTAEEKSTSALQEKRGAFPSQWHLSYSTCFSAVHFVFASLGILGAIASTVLCAWKI